MEQGMFRHWRQLNRSGEKPTLLYAGVDVLVAIWENTATPLIPMASSNAINAATIHEITCLLQESHQTRNC